ncbi:hypothetical protein KP803_09405 [Vibrio sp. ZSDE26]|uniref:Calcium-binding protein n=1 Tax=Vibrio amylolyticus TaxID=2847292 RepID=A0A9X1XIB8_9VIBR|nr:hypothetical protein [Vibrio amylolyticus]
MRGHNGYDNKTAQDGVDTLLIGADGHDDLTGGTGDDVLFGDNSISDTWNAGDDTLDGGAGNDMIFAGGGNDTIYGDEKRPAHLATNAENDIIDGGEGIDTLKYNETYKNADALKVMAVDSDTFNVDSILSGQITSTDTVSNVEILQTTRGDDVIDFSALGHGMTLQTLTGNDTVTGSGHDDVINVGIGNDTIIGSGGNDVINGGSGNDEIIYAAGTNISIEANGAAYKKEYKITNLDDDSFDIVSSIESISVENGVSYSLSDGEYSSLG